MADTGPTLMLVGADAPLTVLMYGRMREGASPDARVSTARGAADAA